MPYEPQSELDRKVLAAHPVTIYDPLKLGKTYNPKTPAKDNTKLAGYHDGEDKRVYDKFQKGSSTAKFTRFSSLAARVARDETGGNTSEYAESVDFDFDVSPYSDAIRTLDLFESMGATCEANRDGLLEGKRPYVVHVHAHSSEANRHESRRLRTTAGSPEEAAENAQSFYGANHYDKVDVKQILPESNDVLDLIIEAKTRPATDEEKAHMGKVTASLRNAVKKNMHPDGSIKDYSVHMDLVGKHEDLLRKHGFSVHRGQLRKHLTEEDIHDLEVLDEAKTKRWFPLTTAQHRANKNEGRAEAAWNNGEKKASARFLRAHDRYTRIARGKKPFSKRRAYMESEEHVEFDMLDEISKDLAIRYLKKAGESAVASGYIAGHTDGTHSIAKVHNPNAEPPSSVFARRMDTRTKGISRAVNRATGTTKRARIMREDVDKDLISMFGEEYTQLDEIARKTLASYIHKATDDLALHASDYGKQMAHAKAGPDDAPHYAERKKTIDRAMKRIRGIKKASSVLAKEDFDAHLQDVFGEEYEQLDELSKQAIGSYLKAAHRDIRDTADYGGHEEGKAGAVTKSVRWADAKVEKRQRGMDKAIDRLTKK